MFAGGEESLRPALAGLDSASCWLRENGISTRRLASLFGSTPNHIRQLVYRGKHSLRKPPVDRFLTDPVVPPADPFGPPTTPLRRSLGVRLHEDAVILNRRERGRLEELENKVESAAEQVFSGVRYETGIPMLRSLASEIGYPAHHRRIRLLGRIRQLTAETLLHSGRSASALDYGLRALHLSRIAYHEFQDPYDLQQLGRSARLISQTYLLRAEPGHACRFLEIHREARARAGKNVRPEYHHQMGTVALQEGDDDTAKSHFQEAMRSLAEMVEDGRAPERHEILDIGARQINLLTPANWDRSQELMDYMLLRFHPDDIHVSINVTWTVACGFRTDSPSAQQQATDLLHQYKKTADGFGRQATIARLLEITPFLPSDLRAAWVRRALYENVLRDR